MLRAAGGGRGGAREVVLKYGIELDKKFETVLDRMGKRTKETQDRMRKSAQDSARDFATSWERGLANVDRMMDRSASGQKRWNDGLLRLGAQRIDQADREAKIRERASRAEEQRIKREERERTTAQNRMIRANKQFENQLDRTISGFTQLGRAIALTGVIGERDMQKLLNVLLGVQVAMDAIHGGIAVYRGIKGMRGAASAMGGGGAAGGGGGLGAAVAGGIGAGIGGRAAPAFAMKAAPLAGAAAPWLGAGFGVVSGAVGGGSAVGQAWKYGLGAGAEPGTWADSIGGGYARTMGYAQRIPGVSYLPEFLQPGWPFVGSEARESQLGANQFSEAGRKAVSEAEKRMADIRTRQQHLARDESLAMQRADAAAASAGFNAIGNNRSDLAAQDAARARYETLRNDPVASGAQVVQSRMQLLEIERQIRAERLTGARGELEATKGSLETARQREQMLRERNMSIQERLGNLSPGQYRNVETLTRKALSGAQLSPEERAQLDSAGATESPLLRNRLRDTSMRVAEERGFSRPGGLGEQLGLQRDLAEARAQRLNLEANVKVRNEIVIKIEGEIEASFKKAYADLKGFFDKQAAEAQQQMKDQANLFRDERTAHMWQLRNSGW